MKRARSRVSAVSEVRSTSERLGQLMTKEIEASSGSARKKLGGALFLVDFIGREGGGGGPRSYFLGGLYRGVFRSLGF